MACPASAQSVNFKEYKTKNGLRVILSEDHSAPTYSIAVTYNVGSRDEKPGRTGFAHLFEHMMFQGSENVGKGEHLPALDEAIAVHAKIGSMRELCGLTGVTVNGYRVQLIWPEAIAMQLTQAK